MSRATLIARRWRFALAMSALAMSALAMFALASPVARAQEEDVLEDDVLAPELEPAPLEPSATDTEPPLDASEPPSAPLELPDELEGPRVQAPDAAGLDAAEPASAQRAVALHAALGFGAGTLAFTRPTRAGTQRLPDAAFAAMDLVLRAHVWPRARFSLDALLAYQTSLGFALQADPLFALPERIDVRVQRLELSAAPTFRLGAAPGALALAFPIGFSFRWFYPEVPQYGVGDYSLGGPQLRVELIAALGEIIRLRIGPEAQWLVAIDGSLRRQGACCSGLAVGGQGSIEAAIGRNFSVAFAYRQAHAFVRGRGSFEDVERFLTARIGGTL